MELLRDKVHRFNAVVSQNQNGDRINSSSSEIEEATATESPPHKISKSAMAFLIEEYDQHMEEMAQQMEQYKGKMDDFKKSLKDLVMDNERLYAELRMSVEDRLYNRHEDSRVEGNTVDDKAIIKNLKEQIQLSEQGRQQVMELWRTASEEVERLNQVYQQAISEEENREAQRQQLKDQLSQVQQHANQLQATNHNLESSNLQLVKVVTEQSMEMEMLHSQFREAKAEQKKAIVKVEEMAKSLKIYQEQLQRLEEDLAVARGQEDAGNRLHQQLQSAVSQLEARLKVAAVDVEQARTEKAEWEKVVLELRKQCTTLEEEKYEALDNVKVYAQAAKNAELEMAQALLREKQKTEALQNTQEYFNDLIHQAPVRIRKEVENIQKQYKDKVISIQEELCALQLECTKKQSQIDRILRERNAVEEELAKVNKERRAESELKQINALHERCVNAERMKDDMSFTLQSTQNKLKQKEIECSEKLSRYQEEVQQLKKFLAAARNECTSLSDDRIKLQQEILQLHKEIDELRKDNMLNQKKAKQQVSQMEQAYSLKEKLLDTRIQELEQCSRSSRGDLTRLLVAQQKLTQRFKEETTNTVQAFEAKIAKLKTEMNQQKQHSHKLEMQIKIYHISIDEYERQFAEYNEKMSRLQKRLTEAEQKATVAMEQQLTMLRSQRRKTAMDDPET